MCAVLRLSTSLGTTDKWLKNAAFYFLLAYDNATFLLEQKDSKLRYCSTNQLLFLFSHKKLKNLTFSHFEL